MSDSIYTDTKLRPLLDEKFYSLESDELAFLKSQTGIQDEEELKQHVLSAQARAYDIYGYPCIRRFSFAKLTISKLPGYQRVLEMARERENAIFLDIGCCFGNAIRKVVADGWPARNAIASDLRQGFWDYGHEFFKSTPQTFPATFIAGDVFDNNFIAPHEPFYDDPDAPRPTFDSLTSLTPLQGHISAIHASLFFHLFDEAHQIELARRMASLLSPLPGSVIFGLHGSRPEKGLRTEARIPGRTKHMFCHSPESWEEVWNGGVFKAGSVRVDSKLVEVERSDISGGIDAKFYMLAWSVTRL